MKLFKKIFKGNTLYYPGCLTKFVGKDFAERYKKILEKEGIEFITLKDKEFCCGSPVRNAGGKEAFKKLAKNNLKVFKDHGVARIITNCPSCAAMFKKNYKEILGDEWDIEAFHVAEIIKKSAVLNSKNKDKKATYHDSCHLGRTLGIYDEPREIIKKTGLDLKEMEFSRDKSFCCGGGGGVKSNNPELSNRIGKSRTKQAKKTGAEVLVTNCPMCALHLAENSEGLEVKELSELLEE